MRQTKKMLLSEIVSEDNAKIKFVKLDDLTPNSFDIVIDPCPTNEHVPSKYFELLKLNGTYAKIITSRSKAEINIDLWNLNKGQRTLMVPSVSSSALTSRVFEYLNKHFIRFPFKTISHKQIKDAMSGLIDGSDTNTYVVDMKTLR
ncbi:hypothetical protein ACOME3_003741 [Neoechinorhynchus agilis]